MDRAYDRWEIFDTQLTTDLGEDHVPFVFEDSSGDIWVFWSLIKGINYDVWFKRFSHDGGWGRAMQLTTTTNLELLPFALEDKSGDIWVFWMNISMDFTSYNIWYKKLIPVI